MTNEEAIEILYNIRGYYASLTVECPPHDCYELGGMKCSDICNALLKGIKLLEQKPILDKIRAEIEEYRSRQLTLAIGVEDLEEGKQVAIEYILAIIAKYQTESVR